MSKSNIFELLKLTTASYGFGSKGLVITARLPQGILPKALRPKSLKLHTLNPKP